MKIFKSIKNYISSFFDDFGFTKKAIALRNHEIGLSKSDGPTNIDMHNIHIDGFPNKQSETITDEEIDDILKNLLSSHNLNRLDKKIVLLDMVKDCIILQSALTPLIMLNLNYTLDLVGGSIRDFLLNKHKEIKDLDILIHITPEYKNAPYFSHRNINNKLLNTTQLLKDEWCTKEELIAVDFFDKDSLEEKHNKLVQLCLNREHEIFSSKIFSKEDRFIEKPVYGPDILKELTGIIKVDGEKFKYPLELLITDHPREYFYKSIDFGLCNVGFKILDLITKDKHILDNFEDMAKNFVISTDFCEDFKNKTLTYNSYNRTPDQIEYSFSNHLKRVISKYPEYKVRINDEHTDEQTKKCIESVMLMDNLTETLDSNDNKSAKTKRAKL